MEENSVQISSIPAVWLLPSFDHLIGSIQHRLRIREADLLGGFEIDHQLEFRRLLHGQIGGFCSLEYQRRQRRDGGSRLGWPNKT